MHNAGLGRTLDHFGGNMYIDWFCRSENFRSNKLTKTLQATALSTFLMGGSLTFAQIDNQFSPSSTPTAILPSQNDATYTPDPYYSPEPSLNAPLDTTDSEENIWSPPIPAIKATKAATVAAKPDNQVRSLLENEAWEPPLTPIAPGYDPTKLSYSAIPYMAKPNANIKPAGATNSIVRPNALTPQLTTNNQIISNSFAKPSKSDFSAATPESTPVRSLAPSLTIPRPKAKPKVPARARGSNFAVEPEPTKSLARKTDKPESTKPKTNRTASKPKSQKSGTPASSKKKHPISVKPPGAETFQPTQVLAMVGGEPIFLGDALLEVNQIIEQHMGAAPESAKARERRGLIKRILPKLVDSKMLYVGAIQDLPEEADIEKIVDQASEEFDEKALPDLLKQAKLKDAADYDALLRKMGSSLRKRRDAWARDQLTRYFVSQKLNLDREITHQQLLDEYRENVEAYKIAEKAKWEQIMVRFDRFQSRNKANEAIVELGNRLIYGASLSALAKKSSHGFRADEGGQHDWTGRDALVLKEIDEAIFTLPIGELSDVIETRDGYHIVRVIDRQEASIKPFTEAQVDIKERLKRKMRGEAFDKHLAELRKKIPVEYFTFEPNDAAVTD